MGECDHLPGPPRTALTAFDPGKRSVRAWLIGIARRVFADHCESTTRRTEVAGRLAGRRDLEVDEVDELIRRIDAERAGRSVLARLDHLPQTEREAIELVDLAGLTPSEAAAAVGTGSGAMRVRLFRARKRLRHLCEEVPLETSWEGSQA